MKANIKCDRCGRDFYKKPNRISRSVNHYCSKECIIRGQEVDCSNCGKKLWKEPWKIKKQKEHFCNKQCFSEKHKKLHFIKCNGCGNEFYRVEKRCNVNFCTLQCRKNYITKKNTVKCVVCGVDFEKSPANIIKYPGHCCSIECRSKYNNERVVVACASCGIDVSRPPSLIKGKKKIYCSDSCREKGLLTRLTVNCLKCGKSFTKSICYTLRSRHNFCSPTCFSKFHFKESFVESEFEKIIPAGINYDRNNRTALRGLELDFYFPDLNFGVEINGACHYVPVYGLQKLLVQKIRDRKKRQLCKQLGIRLRTIKPGDCKKETYVPRYLAAIKEIKKCQALLNLAKVNNAF